MDITLLLSKKLGMEHDRAERVVFLVGSALVIGAMVVLCQLPVILLAIFHPARDSLAAGIIVWGSFAVWIVLFALVFASLARDSMGDEQSGAGSQDITGQADQY